MMAMEIILLNFQLIKTGWIHQRNIIHMIIFHDIGWQVVDITKAVKQWQNDYRTNQGLLVEVTESDSHQQIHPETVGLTSNRNAKKNQEVGSNTNNQLILAPTILWGINSCKYIRHSLFQFLYIIVIYGGIFQKQ